MSVDTEIEGQPGSIETAADWLQDKLAVATGAAADRMNDSRRSAQDSWQSAAGDEFASSIKKGRDTVDDLQSAATTMAEDLDDFAGKLRHCQEHMATIRSDASVAGLTVAGFLIEDPGPGPARPADTITGTPEQVEAWRREWDAYNEHQDLRRAYQHASREAARIDRMYGAACQDLQDGYTVGEHAAWLVNVTDVLGDGASAAIGVHIQLTTSRLNSRAQDLVDEAKRAVADLQAHPERYLTRKWIFFKRLDATKLEADRLAVEGKLSAAEALLKESEAARAARFPRFLGRAGKVLGPLGIALGVYNDYQEGESYTQIAVSQGVSAAVGAGAGFGASLAAGAATGALIGSVVPGAGTVVGAVVGTAVGAGVAIFADGAIDSLFENGPDVGKAFDEGVDALADTGDAISDGVSSAVDTVGGWFS